MKQKDDYLLELALVSDADFLITGDKDLLDIKKNGKLPNINSHRI